MGEFLIGAATSAHQVEGNNTKSDAWAMEQMEHSSYAEPSGDAADHYHRYREDIALLAQAGLNAYRFSIEWARIEPQEGVFDEEVTAHYREVLKTCHAFGVEPIVTLHHFSSPQWLIRLGGWEDERVVFYFARYCEYIAMKLGEDMHYICTINEANMGLQIAAMARQYQKEASAKQSVLGGSAACVSGENPGASGGKKENSNLQVGIDLTEMAARAKEAEKENLAVFGVAIPQVFLSARTKKGDGLVIRAHQEAKKKIKAVNPKLLVGITLSLHDIQAFHNGEETVRPDCGDAIRKEWEEEFLHYVPYLKDDDFIGVQNYTRSLMDQDGRYRTGEGTVKTQMGYEYYPQALEHVIRKVYKELPIPILVTENGIATKDDTLRCTYLEEALKGVHACIRDGILVVGYCHWSLLDNFEWQKGYGMEFGLIAVDRVTQKRFPKKSLYRLGEMGRKM